MPKQTAKPGFELLRAPLRAAEQTALIPTPALFPAVAAPLRPVPTVVACTHVAPRLAALQQEQTARQKKMEERRRARERRNTIVEID